MKKNFQTTVSSKIDNFLVGCVVLELECDHDFKAEPGQFVVLEPLKSGCIFGRPFSVFKQSANRFSVAINVVGENTRLYSELSVGDKISVIGPLGKPIGINKLIKNHILVAGGMGAACLTSLAEKLFSLGMPSTFFYGARDKKNDYLLPCQGVCCPDSKNITDDQGMVTDLLERFLQENDLDPEDIEIIACGPKPMLKKVAEISKTRNLSCQVVMEDKMACGVGSCKGCAIPKVGGGYFHLCQDGPALPGGEIDWESLSRPNATAGEKKIKPDGVNMQTVLQGCRKNIAWNDRVLNLSSPIILDSGCIDYEAIQAGPVDISCVGAIKSKGITMEPRAGNKPPRICETASGMLNSIGLENIGLEKFISEHLPKLKGLGKPVIVNISGSTAKEFRDMAKRLVEAGVDIIELNLSCPNTERGEEIFGKSPRDTFYAVNYVREELPTPFLMVKLSPMAADVLEIAKAAAMAGADALSGFNTFLGMKIDLATRRPAIGKVYGGMSGPAVMPMALRMVHLLCQGGLGIPIIGGTGITRGADAAEYMVAGAKAVTIGSGLFTNPRVATEVYHELREIIAGYGMTDIKQLVGSLII